MGSEVEGGRKLLNMIQAAKVKGVSKRTVYNWVTEGRLQQVQTKHGPRVYEDELLAVRKWGKRES